MAAEGTRTAVEAVIPGVEEEGTTRTLAAEAAATQAAAAVGTAGGAAAVAAGAASVSTRSWSPCTALRRRCTPELSSPQMRQQCAQNK